MTTTLVLPQPLSNEMRSCLGEPRETAGVLLAVVLEDENGIRLLGQKINWASEDSYLERDRDGLSLKSSAYIHALGEAEQRGCIPIWFHSHPGETGVPLPSPRDRRVDQQIADLFRIRSGGKYYGALIASPRPEGFAFSGHLESEGGGNFAVDRIWTVGGGLRLTHAYNRAKTEIPSLFDRNVRAFGDEIQAVLADLHVGIVGCGGIGSAVAEQLVRLGVKHFSLVDPDVLSESNVTRVYGSNLSLVGKPKVEIAAAHLRSIGEQVLVRPIQSMVTCESTARYLSSCDIIFGCTDDNAGRLVLSRLATFFVIPVIDCGVLITSKEDGQIVGIDGRVTTMEPGQACLVCRNRIDIARASAEQLTPGERVRLQNEGYAPALGRTEPAVVAFTTQVASTAVSEMLERLIGYGPEPRPSEVLLRFHEREISTNRASPRTKHYCDPASGKLGVGNTNPFLEQAWPE